MSQLIEDYALVGDTHTAALVGMDGSIDWLCLPRFDSGACLAALLGDSNNGRWLIHPRGATRASRRRYRGDTLVLETEFAMAEGTVRVVDFLPIREEVPELVRIVEGVSGAVEMEMELILRFDYGSTVPWVRRIDGELTAIAGPNAVALRTPVQTRGRGLSTVATFTIRAGDRLPFVLSWYPSNGSPPAHRDPYESLDSTERWWREWSSRCSYRGPYRDAVIRSLITLKALTYAPTGGMVAAPTTSLPESLGGVRNWDYRYCWLRDATFTLYALMQGGYRDEARAWRDWLLRAVAGDPAQIQIMYGLSGERQIPELELDWLAGYQSSKPVRIGNAAVKQLQIDVFGELMDALYVARRSGIESDAAAWDLQRHLLRHLEKIWRNPDEGIWEVRGGGQPFTYSRVMAWVAVDRCVRAVEKAGLAGPVDEWKRLRAEIHDDVCRHGFDPELGSFVQSYGSRQLDASLLLIPLVGFLPPEDPRVRGTVHAVESGLVSNGFIMRYSSKADGPDGLPPGEGAFLPCSFWLVDAYAQTGRMEEARRLFQRLLGVRNDVGLLAEEYDTAANRLVGNFPQALSHVALVNSASNLMPVGTGTTAHRTGDHAGAPGEAVGAAAAPEAGGRDRGGNRQAVGHRGTESA
jgi:GH15 family glucan-1,4-alpha-glucosidase